MSLKLDSTKTKIAIFIASSVSTVVVVLLYFLDSSLGWETIKIVSCVIVSIWSWFVIPSFRYVYLHYIKDITVEQSVRLGFHIAINGIMLPILIAPYFGLRYYMFN